MNNTWFEVYQQNEDSNLSPLIAFCRYLNDAKLIQEKEETYKIRCVIQKNTWEWKAI